MGMFTTHSEVWQCLLSLVIRLISMRIRGWGEPPTPQNKRTWPFSVTIWLSSCRELTPHPCSVSSCPKLYHLIYNKQCSQYVQHNDACLNCRKTRPRSLDVCALHGVDSDKARWLYQQCYYCWPILYIPRSLKIELLWVTKCSCHHACISYKTLYC